VHLVALPFLALEFLFCFVLLQAENLLLKLEELRKQAVTPEQQQDAQVSKDIVFPRCV